MLKYKINHCKKEGKILKVLIAEVLLNKPSKHLDRTFSYRVPYELKNVTVGYRCIVPFSNHKLEGVILALYEKEESELKFALRNVISLIDDFPWFTKEMIELARKVSSYYLCTMIDALRLFYIDKDSIRRKYFYKIHWEKVAKESLIWAMIDTSVTLLDEDEAKLLLKDNLDVYIKKQYLEKIEEVSTVYKKPIEPWITLLEKKEESLKKGTKQFLLFEYLKEHKDTSLKNLKYEGFSLQVVRSFVQKGYARIYYKHKGTYSLVQGEGERLHRVLTDEQKAAIDSINHSIDQNSFEGILLKGVTGSGKTEVYLRTVLHAISKGGSVIILVPEIALTDQMTNYFKDFLGEKVVFIHSNLNKNERYNNRQRILNGESSVIIGSRSALFMPVNNLKLIVVDEEYDSSYKSDETPRYNGRDVAKMLATIHRCPIVLGAATPSVATFYSAKSNQIKLLEMKDRIFNTALPEINVVDMKSELGLGEDRLISALLAELLEKTLSQGNKSILLLNRRGYATAVLCSTCGNVIRCPYCDIPLVYHKDTRKLHCHYCERVFPMLRTCEKCHSEKFLYLGLGTQRIENELAKILPDAHIARLDLDSSRGKNNSRNILDGFREGKYDILLGTQMVAKGHDIKGVQSVGILQIDQSLNFPSYLAPEHTFNLITQSAGRAGRNKEQGKVILQTFNPNHYVVETAADQDYESFFKREISYRYNLHFPPFYKLIKITTFNKNTEKAVMQIQRIYRWLVETKGRLGLDLEISSPNIDNIRRLRDKSYISLFIKGKTVRALKEEIRNSKIFKENDIIIDVDPI